MSPASQPAISTPFSLTNQSVCRPASQLILTLFFHAFTVLFSSKYPYFSIFICHAAAMASDSKHDYTFKKLTGSANYKQWTRDMAFALEEAKLWDHVVGTASPPPALVPKENDTEERSERIYQRTLKIKDHTDDVRRTVAKIGRMCTETVQKEFLTLKPLTAWIPKDLWDHLKTRYTLQNWTSKWSTLGKLHSIHQRDCKNVAEFISKIRDITSEISDLNITMDEAIIIHTLNSLDDHFKYYLAILSHDARENDKIPTLDTLSNALEDEELRLTNQDKGTANYIKKRRRSLTPRPKKTRLPTTPTPIILPTPTRYLTSVLDVRRPTSKGNVGWTR